MSAPTFLLDDAHRPVLAGTSRRITSSAPAILVALLGLFAATGVMLATAVVEGWRIDRRFETRGRAAPGRVLGLRREHDDGTTYFVAWTYEVDGTSWRRESAVREADYVRVSRGDEVVVEYLPEDPSTSRIRDFGSTKSAPFAVVFTTLWLAFSLGSLLHALRTRHREAQLAREGVLVEGRITRVGAKLDDDSYHVTVGYTFETLGGPGRGHRTAIRDDLRGRALPLVGDRVAVLCLDAERHLLL